MSQSLTSASQKKNGWRSFRKGLWTFQFPKSHFESRACNKQRWAIKAWGRHSPCRSQIHSLLPAAPKSWQYTCEPPHGFALWASLLALWWQVETPSEQNTNSSCLEDKALRLLQTEIALCPLSPLFHQYLLRTEKLWWWYPSGSNEKDGEVVLGQEYSWLEKQGALGLWCFCFNCFL